MKPKTLRVNAKCSDLCWMALVSADGTHIAERDGYVPDFMPGEHYGDYIEIDIDIETGMITNWKKPTKEQLKEAFPDGKPIV